MIFELISFHWFCGQLGSVQCTKNDQKYHLTYQIYTNSVELHFPSASKSIILCVWYFFFYWIKYLVPHMVVDINFIHFHVIMVNADDMTYSSIDWLSVIGYQEKKKTRMYDIFVSFSSTLLNLLASRCQWTLIC